MTLKLFCTFLINPFPVVMEDQKSWRQYGFKRKNTTGFQKPVWKCIASNHTSEERNSSQGFCWLWASQYKREKGFPRITMSEHSECHSDTNRVAVKHTWSTGTIRFSKIPHFLLTTFSLAPHCSTTSKHIMLSEHKIQKLWSPKTNKQNTTTTKKSDLLPQEIVALF